MESLKTQLNEQRKTRQELSQQYSPETQRTIEDQRKSLLIQIRDMKMLPRFIQEEYATKLQCEVIFDGLVEDAFFIAALKNS